MKLSQKENLKILSNAPLRSRTVFNVGTADVQSVPCVRDGDLWEMNDPKKAK